MKISLDKFEQSYRR